MQLIRTKWIRVLLLASFYLLGSLGIIATGSSGGGGDNDFECDIFVKSISPVNDGSNDIYIVAQVYTASDDQTVLARLNSDGTSDKNFINYSAGYRQPIVFAASSDGSGDVYVNVGENNVWRLNGNGTQDTGFAAVGIGSNILAIATANDGSGDVFIGGSFSSKLVRLNDDGSVDSGFTIDAGFDDNVAEIEAAIDGSGDLYVASYQGFIVPHLVRFNSDGSRDLNFTPSAVPTVTDSYQGNTIAVATDGSGDIFVSYFSVIDFSQTIGRLNDDGSPDADFSTGSGFSLRDVYTVAPATDGTRAIYAGGDFLRYNGDSNSDIVRIKSDGSKDFNFITGAGFSDPRPPTPGFSGFPSGVYYIAPATDGTSDIFVGGNFTDYNGSKLNGMVRLNDDGTIDNSFSIRLDYGGSTCSIETLFEPF